MSVIYRLGSKGPEVAKLQAALQAKEFYAGPIDGNYGGGTESAVRQYQQAYELDVDGRVGPRTWTSLFSEPIAPPALTHKPLVYRCLALTGSFETSTGIPDCFAGLSGDFDGQGISFGALQWNFGQGSLPPLLVEADRKHANLLDRCFGPNADVLRQILGETHSEQMAWARSIQTPKRNVAEPWRGQFKALGRTDEFQGIEVDHAQAIFGRALGLLEPFQLWSERAVALMFDILTQNGGIRQSAKAAIQQDYLNIPAGLPKPELEVKRMSIVAQRVAGAANPKWQHDVLVRKLTVADGNGTVHGAHYDLAADYGIRLMAIST